ncbi:MAG: YbgC/FadM family acyl-CoA thioesterase [Campylobacterales bacterium]|nr:YbgC/FadM family acyl-CoA thioesterase [Campylobacterales bacterium]
MQIRVYYEDTDAGGIVYHTNYIKFCERARSEMFFSRGMVPFDGDKSGFVVHHIDADFLSTARLGDLLEVQTHIHELKNSSIILLQEVYKETKKIFSMKIRLAYLAQGKPSRIPSQFKEIFQAL